MGIYPKPTFDPGTTGQFQVLAPIGPLATGTLYPTHIDLMGQGGYMAVPALSDMYEIPYFRRKLGMAVYVTAESKLYILTTDPAPGGALNGASNTVTTAPDWTEFEGGGGGGYNSLQELMKPSLNPTANNIVQNLDSNVWISCGPNPVENLDIVFQTSGDATRGTFFKLNQSKEAIEIGGSAMGDPVVGDMLVVKSISSTGLWDYAELEWSSNSGGADVIIDGDAIDCTGLKSPFDTDTGIEGLGTGGINIETDTGDLELISGAGNIRATARGATEVADWMWEDLSNPNWKRMVCARADGLLIHADAPLAEAAAIEIQASETGGVVENIKTVLDPTTTELTLESEGTDGLGNININALQNDAANAGANINIETTAASPGVTTNRGNLFATIAGDTIWGGRVVAFTSSKSSSLESTAGMTTITSGRNNNTGVFIEASGTSASIELEADGDVDISSLTTGDITLTTPLGGKIELNATTGGSIRLAGAAIGAPTAGQTVIASNVNGDLEWGDPTTSIYDTVTVVALTATIDFDNGNFQELDLDSNPAPAGAVVLTLDNPSQGSSYTIKILSGSNVNTLTWPASVLWEGGTALLTPTPGSGSIDMVSLAYDGTNFLASYGTNFV